MFSLVSASRNFRDRPDRRSIPMVVQGVGAIMVTELARVMQVAGCIDYSENTRVLVDELKANVSALKAS